MVKCLRRSPLEGDLGSHHVSPGGALSPVLQGKKREMQGLHGLPQGNIPVPHAPWVR